MRPRRLPRQARRRAVDRHAPHRRPRRACCRSRPRVVLLDEPSSGIAQREAEALRPAPARRARPDRLRHRSLIEHDMPLLLGLADRVYALEIGRRHRRGRARGRGPRPGGRALVPRRRPRGHQPQRRTDGPLAVDIVTLGLVVGMANALLAVGLVLISMSNRVINFAHGELGAFGVAMMLTLTRNAHLNYWLALLASLARGGRCAGRDHRAQIICAGCSEPAPHRAHRDDRHRAARHRGPARAAEGETVGGERPRWRAAPTSSRCRSTCSRSSSAASSFCPSTSWRSSPDRSSRSRSSPSCAGRPTASPCGRRPRTASGRGCSASRSGGSRRSPGWSPRVLSAVGVDPARTHHRVLGHRGGWPAVAHARPGRGDRRAHGVGRHRLRRRPRARRRSTSSCSSRPAVAASPTSCCSA